MQLEKWRMEFGIVHHTLPKRVLIVDTFRETELEQRKSLNFPAQMKPLSENREHCLMTGVHYFACTWMRLRIQITKIY